MFYDSYFDFLRSPNKGVEVKQGPHPLRDSH